MFSINFRRFVIVVVLITTVISVFAGAGSAKADAPKGKILFTSDRGAGYGVYVVNTDGTNLHKLVQDSYSSGTTSWSSANKIVYVSIRDGKPQIYMIDPDGGNQTRITDNTSWAINPSWYPDGKQLLYAYENKETAGVNTLDIVSGNVKPMKNVGVEGLKLSPDGKMVAFYTSGLTVANADGTNPRVVYNNNLSGFTWSPDSKSLAFAAWGQQGEEIDIVSVKGGKPTLLAKHSSMDLAWSPDGKYILYADYNQKEGAFGLSLIALDGSGEKFLLTTDGESKGFSWSPDGKQITFNSGLDRRISIYSMDMDGSNVTQLTDMPGISISDTAHPFLSPDGSRILFAAQGNILTMDADGKNQQTLTQGNHPIWSPDGKRIAFGSYDANTKKAGFFVMDADGSNRSLLTIQVGNLVSWSPDGQKIMFQVSQWSDPKAAGIYLVDANGQNPTRLTQDAGNYPAFSPDSKQIAYCAIKDFKLTVMAADGKKLHVIAPKSFCVKPAWSPDSKQVAAIASGQRGFNIELTDANGKNNHLVTALNPRMVWDKYVLAWSPDGKQLLFTSDMDGNPEVYSINPNGKNLINLTNNVFDDELADVWMPK